MTFCHASEILAQASRACTECGRCAKRCEVLEESGAFQERTIGSIARDFLSCLEKSPDSDLQAEAIRILATQDPDLIFTVRRCCMCAFCTQTCPEGIDARSVFAAIRELLSAAGVTGTQGFESTQVDKEWHIFSVYRAVYGIHYVDLPHLEQAKQYHADTLFFPGCPLASYAPELTREIFAWFERQGIKAVISEECCGSPLKSAGFGQRARAFKQSFAEKAAQNGIGRVVFVCPGCLSELSNPLAEQGIQALALPQLLHDAGMRIEQNKIDSACKTKTAELRVSVSDSCFDRSGRFGKPLRAMLPSESLVELAHSQKSALCCGAGGSASLVDQEICTKRTQRIFDEGAEAGSDLLVTVCPTCSYTLAYQDRTQSGTSAVSVPHINYLELVFESKFDWNMTFSQLEGMWSGEYGPWVIQQLT